jgi:hypothetical protein
MHTSSQPGAASNTILEKKHKPLEALDEAMMTITKSEVCVQAN